MNTYLLYVKNENQRESIFYQITVEHAPLTKVYVFCCMGKVDAVEGIQDYFTNQHIISGLDYFDFFSADFHQHFNATDIHNIIKLIAQNVDFSQDNS